jgi:hypothetical protein
MNDRMNKANEIQGGLLWNRDITGYTCHGLKNSQQDTFIEET